MRIFSNEDNPHVVITNGLEITNNLGIESALYIANWLLKTWQSDAQVEFMLRTRVFWIIPVVNVDAYLRFESGFDGTY